MSTTTTTSLKPDVEVKERVERLAAAKQRSPDGIMQEAIVEYVTRAEKREQFRLDTLASWEHYQATGFISPMRNSMSGWLGWKRAKTPRLLNATYKAGY